MIRGHSGNLGYTLNVEIPKYEDRNAVEKKIVIQVLKSWMNEELLEGWKVTGTEGVINNQMTRSSKSCSLFVFRVVVAMAAAVTAYF